jgi:hypothetical protein
MNRFVNVHGPGPSLHLAAEKEQKLVAQISSLRSLAVTRAEGILLFWPAPLNWCWGNEHFQ